VSHQQAKFDTGVAANACQVLHSVLHCSQACKNNVQAASHPTLDALGHAGAEFPHVSLMDGKIHALPQALLQPQHRLVRFDDCGMAPTYRSVASPDSRCGRMQACSSASRARLMVLGRSGPGKGTMQLQCGALNLHTAALILFERETRRAAKSSSRYSSGMCACMHQHVRCEWESFACVLPGVFCHTCADCDVLAPCRLTTCVLPSFCCRHCSLKPRCHHESVLREVCIVELSDGIRNRTAAGLSEGQTASSTGMCCQGCACHNERYMSHSHP